MARKKTVAKTKKTPIKTKIPRAKGNRRFSRLRGMRDVLPEEYKYWELALRKANELASAYDFRRLETPIMESADLYEKSSGRTSDIVAKEMYSFIDKNGERVAMRPEATPGLVRAYIEYGMFNQPQPVKLFWLGPVFRHDRPQAGRYRQHHQFNLDIFGESSPVADFLIILIAHNFFRELQINAQVQINSIGCRECRKEYIEKLIEFYKERGKRTNLCGDCKKRIAKNPLRLLDCKEDKCIAIREGAPQIVDYLCDSCREHFIKVLEYLDELDLPYNLNPFLVRGLDYYNRTVFEFISLTDDTDQDAKKDPMSLGGGGRYDDLVEHMGGRTTAACGFGLGLERTILKMKENNIPIRKDIKDIIFIAQLGEQARRKVITLFEELRRANFKVRQAFTKDGLKAQLEEANRVGAKYSLILGQKEVMEGTILLRDMESGIQEIIDYKKIRADIEKRLKSDK
ncbi:histidine--tRNA ligase [Candidatus Falkowbacteria bacterium CG11_big_fil_rev_8_21_14_0_20_39_10]|uniref:Histidine--tRNA ligase n=1 Tax=Candidatus Falkowbacteria bacterium CG11_big_fil_rev_8_21_14_0_20_39_10 TaxID=1974570 RepID=A0A2M6K8U2_9BACT|nr:MAG: histidine--tRNA ligase [Candidatus Falkowbacteria bacterium CG11_big_fil_rev_8_21_14_0_20_39_10]